jgi:hypothetical protein
MTHWWQVPIVGAIVGNLAFLVLKTANGCDVFVDRDGAWLRGECFRWEDMDEVHLERNDGEREVVLNMRDDREGLSVDGFDLPKAAYHGLLEVLDRGLTDPGLRPTGTAPAEERAASPGVSEGLMWTLVALPALGSCAAASVLIIERGYV